ncbi:MAG: ATP-binding protein [Pseudomonadota bacterium]
MLDGFPSFQTMVAIDLFLLGAALIGTIFILIKWHQIKEAGAAIGALICIAGLWTDTGLYVADLASMIAMPPLIGMERSMAFMTDLHLKYSWYVSVVSTALIALGLLILIWGMGRQFQRLKNARTEIEESEQRLAQAAQLAKLGYYWWDAVEDELEFCTEQHARSHGRSMEEYAELATTLSNEMVLIHPDDRERIRNEYLRLRAGNPIEIEYRVPTADGERRVREIARPVFDENGTVVREIGTSLDTTEQYETELRLFQAEKMESIGRLTGGVAHDFNNLLAVMMGNLELLRSEVDQPDLIESIETALLAAERGGELTKNMLTFARQARLNPTIVDINATIRQTKLWLSRTLPANIEVETSLLANLWRVSADSSSTQNALLNLIINARDAMPSGGKLTIETANVRIDDEYIAVRSEDVPPGRYVMVAVSDTGDGIESELIDKVFEPFFSTKLPGQGSGLGLPMVQGFIKQSGGAIRVYSELGVGTTIKLYFPAVFRDGEGQGDAHPDTKPTTTQHAKILVAEDEPEVLAIIVRVLENAHYSVFTAPSGDKALELFQSIRPIDLLLTDIVMPGSLQGPKLAKALREVEPDLPTVFMSGYPNEATVHGNGLRPEDIRLMKPVPATELIAAVEKALRTRRTSSDEPN